MGLQDSIVQLMLGKGNVLADIARQKVAQEELDRQNQHRILKGTLRVLATVGPYFIPGIGPFAPVISGGLNQAMGQHDPAFLSPSQNPDILVQHRSSGSGNPFDMDTLIQQYLMRRTNPLDPSSF